MKKVVYIGTSGHGGSFTLASSVLNRHETDYVGVAPGSVGENVKGIMPSLVNNGFNPTMYDDYNEMLLKEKPDIAVVDCFYGDHAKAAKAAFEAGCHVFCEKPVATSLEDLAMLRDAYMTAGTEFTAMFNYRYTGNFYRAWQLIQEGKIGEVRLINAQKSYKMGTRPPFTHDRATYGGTIPWVGSHAIDWVSWMSGKNFLSVTAAQSRVANGGNGTLETDALCLYKMEDDVLASVTIDYLNPKTAKVWGEDRIRVVGTSGVVECRPKQLMLLNEDAEGFQELDFPEDTEMFNDFLDQIDGKDNVCRVTAEDAFYSTEASIRAQMAADSGEIVLF